MASGKEADCPLTSAADILGRKWSFVIVGHLTGGDKRFSELEAEIPGISSKVLSSNLKSLQGEGIVERSVETNSPIEVRYSLTEKGRDLEPLIGEVERWASEWDV
ncbi:MAG: hypothetical protein MAG715_01174 [Methanonatronarchaeales archaeon]|nr:hypothetical protein [Methanonatronarchaeales archaeon]